MGCDERKCGSFRKSGESDKRRGSSKFPETLQSNNIFIYLTKIRIWIVVKWTTLMWKEYNIGYNSNFLQYNVQR